MLGILPGNRIRRINSPHSGSKEYPHPNPGGADGNTIPGKRSPLPAAMAGALRWRLVLASRRPNKAYFSLPALDRVGKALAAPAWRG